MSKSKPRRTSASKARKPRLKPMTEAGLEEIRSITQQMRVNVVRAIAICQETGEEILDEGRHEFWALVKYVENVQEAVVQLDSKNSTVLQKLIEFHERSDDRTQTTWKSLKGMRSRLAHAFEHIDHAILWDTVNNQFPTLERLLGVLQFNRIASGCLSSLFQVGVWRRLPAVVAGERLDGSNSIPAIVFDERGVAMCLRFGRVADDKMAIDSTRQGLSVMNISLLEPDGEVSELLWPRNPPGEGPVARRLN